LDAVLNAYTSWAYWPVFSKNDSELFCLAHFRISDVSISPSTEKASQKYMLKKKCSVLRLEAIAMLKNTTIKGRLFYVIDKENC
jgi:hypothetical protein